MCGVRCGAVCGVSLWRCELWSVNPIRCLSGRREFPDGCLKTFAWLAWDLSWLWMILSSLRRDFWKERLFTGKHTRKSTDVQLEGRLTRMPSNSYPVNLPPHQYAKSPFNSIAFFLLTGATSHQKIIKMYSDQWAFSYTNPTRYCKKQAARHTQKERQILLRTVVTKLLQSRLRRAAKVSPWWTIKQSQANSTWNGGHRQCLCATHFVLSADEG